MIRIIACHLKIRWIAATLSSALAVLAIHLPVDPAQAAPQSLGLVATLHPVPMRCGPDGCAAQLSSFCLQRERKSPDHGVRYFVAGGAGLSLHIVDANGAGRIVPADGIVQLVSDRGNTAVEARVTAAGMAALGAVEIAVEVHPLVTLLPEAEPGDADPITPEEAAFAAGPGRQLAADIFDSRAVLGESLNILDRTINAIDPQTRLADAERRDLWRRTAGTNLDAPRNGTEAATRVFAACLEDLNRSLVFGLRNCLEGRRDELLIRGNTELWNALDTGS